MGYLMPPIPSIFENSVDVMSLRTPYPWCDQVKVDAQFRVRTYRPGVVPNDYAIVEHESVPQGIVSVLDVPQLLKHQQCLDQTDPVFIPSEEIELAARPRIVDVLDHFSAHNVALIVQWPVRESPKPGQCFGLLYLEQLNESSFRSCLYPLFSRLEREIVTAIFRVYSDAEALRKDIVDLQIERKQRGEPVQDLSGPLHHLRFSRRHEEVNLIRNLDFDGYLTIVANIQDVVSKVDEEVVEAVASKIDLLNEWRTKIMHSSKTLVSSCDDVELLHNALTVLDNFDRALRAANEKRVPSSRATAARELDYLTQRRRGTGRSI